MKPTIGNSKSQMRIIRIAELLDLIPEVETGNENFIFGNVLEFPRARDLDPKLFPYILNECGILLPQKSQIIDLILEGAFFEENLDSTTQNLVLEVLNISEKVLSLPNIDWESKAMFELIDHLLPTTLYEHDLPEELRYWQSDEELFFDSEAEMIRLFKEQPVAVSDLISEVNSIKASFMASQDLVVKKSLILACFSLVESYTRQRILLSIPMLSALPGFNEYLESLLEQETRTEERRAKLMGALEPGKKWERKIPNWQLRNALAHDFNSVQLNGNEIVYKDKNKNSKVIQDDTFFASLIEHVEANSAT